MKNKDLHEANDAAIAVVGMAVRVPGAANVERYWQNLRDGLSSIRRLSDDDLISAGVPAGRISRSDYVPFAAPLENFAEFDAEFFGLSPKEAAIMDPQHRQFLETAWEAMEHAGHPPASVGGNVGVYAGCGMGSYFYFNVCSRRDLVDETGMFLLRHTGNDKDFLSTRASHIFDLNGPSIGIQTACSTSLVAIHYAAQALEAGDCSMALAGGVTIELPQGQGYVYKQDEILSPDGTCRAFDKNAEGTVFGSGAGVVVLRRLEDAIADGDHIWAVLKGSAINNDGAVKASYLAPSVGGQSAAVAKAHRKAGITADSVGYVECHGTGTYLGDPIEVAALTDAFRQTTDATEFCRIGSVKTNIGHLDTAAGVASFVKATLALHNEVIPPSLNFEEPNPAIEFDTSPFRVNAELTPWKRGDTPRRAGVNSLGVGGTNAHVVLEEPPVTQASDESDWPFHPLVISARTKSALDAATDRMAAHLAGPGKDEKLADIAFTLKEGRHAFDRRRVVVAETAEEAARLLGERNPRRVFTHTRVGDNPDVVFMFPGGGAQYAGMARELYDTEPVFREWMDKGLSILEPDLDFDIRAVWLPDEGDEAVANARLQAPSVQLPLIMITEYALARLWMSWGVTPAALIGHSMGENTAACLAGVMSLEDCVRLVLLRGRLFETVEKGGMLSVPLSEHEIAARLNDDLDIASLNAPGLCVVSGTQAALDGFARELKAEGIETRRIQIDIAAHSRLLEPILLEFGAFLETLDLKAPVIPFVSNRTGDWISVEQATDPAYWVEHLRNTVRFRDGLGTLAEAGDRIYIEVGPGTTLTSLAGQHDKITVNQVIATLRHPEDDVADDLHFMGMLARVWAAGGNFDWSQIWADARRNRLPLPTYPFQHSRYFIEPADVNEVVRDDLWLTRVEDRDQWAWKPVWKPTYAECEPEVLETLGAAEPLNWLVFEDDTGLGSEVAKQLRAAGHTVSTARPGDAFSRLDDDAYQLAVERGQDSFDSLLRDLKARDRMPDRVAHLWLVTGNEKARPGSSFFHRVQEQGFWSLFHLARAWAEVDGGDLHIVAVTSEAAKVGPEVLRYPEKATVSGPARVIPREFPGITCTTLDIVASVKGRHPAFGQILEELFAASGNAVAAIRTGKRFEQVWRPTLLPEANDFQIGKGEVVLITGGLGGIGLTLAERLALGQGAKVAIVTRRKLPDRDVWDRLIQLAPQGDRMAARLSQLREIEKAGGSVVVVTADVSNIEEMRFAVEEIRTSLGPISGVVHAAGVIKDAPILSKDPIEIDHVFAPKIQGAQVLATIFGRDLLSWVALFSSSSTVTSPMGQVDYVAANEYLNALAFAQQGGKTNYKVIDWGPWAEVGMALNALNGVADTEEPIGQPVDEPLFDDLQQDSAGRLTYRAEWSTDRLWVLDEHRTRKGDALLPGTGYIELAAEALAARGGAGGVTIENLTFLTPLEVPDGVPVGIRVTMVPTGEKFAMQVESETEGSGFDLRAEATVYPAVKREPKAIDPGAIATRCPRAASLETPQALHLDLGRHWQVAHSIKLGEDEGLARLKLPDGAGPYFLDPALMDIATGFGLPLVEGYRADQFWVPMSYGTIRVFGALPDEVVSWIRSDRANNASATTVRFDVCIAHPDGRVLVEIEGFTMHRLEHGLDLAPKSETELRQPERKLTSIEERLHHTVSQGIPSADGATMFLRAMASDLPQLLVSSLPLEGLVAQIDAEATRAPIVDAGFERPDIDSVFVEPENDIERTLAEFWAELLGIGQIGAEDNFFELGGHSLIAVRLFAKIKAAYAVDFPISILFEVPTIRGCAAMIAERLGGSGESDVVALKRHAPSSFMHLVPMHAGDPGKKTPFFMVAGMFGNVLNLRHLGHLIGTDRAFYGLQARGLFGDVEPHSDFEGAARDYIEEIRQVQPHGPYMIGGFSGGGITAYEIARQFREAGEEVSALIMLDTPLPRQKAITLRDRLNLNFLKFREQGLAYPYRWARDRLLWEFERRRAPELMVDETEFHNVAIKAAFMKATEAYNVAAWDGPMALLRPPLSLRYEVAPGRFVNESREYVDPTNYWSQFAPNLEVIEVPGDHDSMVLEPNVRVLAARMRVILEKADARKTAGKMAPLRAAE